MPRQYNRAKTGETYGRLTVVELWGIKKQQAFMQCKCSCGSEAIVRSTKLLNGTTRSCGCLHKEQVSKAMYKHGESKPPGGSASLEYGAWCHMITRCTNKNHKNYELYGGRGIKVCKRWRVSFEAFLSDMGRKPSLKHSLDRLDTNGHYCQSNCRWATQKEQCRNKRSNHLVTVRGVTKPLIEWAEESGIDHTTIMWRLRHGWSPEVAIFTPSKRMV